MKLDKFNTSSGYYNDICYTTTSDDGTDISLKDRKTEYIEGDNIICQDDCEFSAYNSNYKKAKCECYAKESNLSFADMNINKFKIFDNMKNIKNLMNFNILVCYKNLLSINSIIYNIGSLIIICIIFFHIINVFLFYINHLKKIKKNIKDITLGISNNNLIKELDNTKSKLNFSKKKRRKKRYNKINKTNILENLKSNIKSDNQKISKSNYNIFLNNNYIFNNIKKTTNIITDNNKEINKNFLELNNNNKDKQIEKLKNIMKYNTDEMNDLSYDLALNYDKRSYCQFYISLLRVKHNLIYSFYNYDDYNSRIIKIDLFFIGLIMDYAVNALFFNDETMHKIYIDKGLFDWETQIPITIYSFLISTILNIPLSLLGLSNDSIIAFKHLKNIGIKKKRKKLIFCLKLKFIFYFLISFIFLLFFWYYISIFGVVYKNTQYHLLKDTLLSFALSLFYPFITCLLTGLFRITSLSNPKKKRECLYNFSKILQLI